MKGVTSWDFHPYLPPLTENGGIYVCRIAPSKNAVHVEWQDAGEDIYTVSYKKAEGGEEKTLTIEFYFSPDADNSAQGQTVSFNITADATQKKNNPDKDFGN